MRNQLQSFFMLIRPSYPHLGHRWATQLLPDLEISQQRSEMEEVLVEVVWLVGYLL